MTGSEDLKGRTLRAIGRLLRLAGNSSDDDQDAPQQGSAADSVEENAAMIAAQEALQGGRDTAPDNVSPTNVIPVDTATSPDLPSPDSLLSEQVQRAHDEDDQLDALLRSHASLAADRYRNNAAELTDHLALVVKNNPEKTIQEIMGRSDIQQVMHKVLSAAYQQSLDGVDAGHLAGGALGGSHAADEAAQYGLRVDPLDVPRTSPTIDSIKADMERNYQAASNRILVGAQTGYGAAILPPSYHEVPAGSANPVADLASERADNVTAEIDRVMNDLGNRSAAAGATATMSTYNDMKLATFRAVAGSYQVTIQKIWICQLDPGSCGECVALHGTVVDMEEEFSDQITFASGDADDSYDGLDAPPRHPYCGCVIIMVIQDPDPHGGPLQDVVDSVDPDLVDDTVAGFRQDAIDVANASPILAPRFYPGDTLTDTARDSETLMSSDLQVATNPQFEQAVDSFKSCIFGTHGNG